MPDTRASNPTSSGPSLLDKSTARPGEVDMAIFEKNQAQSGSATSGGSQKSQGAVNANYLEECRRDNPTPADEKSAKRTVTLSDCRIDTPSEDLATDQPFKMSCVATSSNGKPVTGGVTFRLFCTLPDGTEEDTGLAKVGNREGDRICAEGTLYSPKKLVKWGVELKYRVVAEHGDAVEKEKSGVVEVVGYMPPKPVAVWEIHEEVFLNRTALLSTRFKIIAEEVCKAAGGIRNPTISVCLGANTSNDRLKTLTDALTHNVAGWWEVMDRYIHDNFYISGMEYIIHTVLKPTPYGQPNELGESIYNTGRILISYLEMIAPTRMDKGIFCVEQGRTRAEYWHTESQRAQSHDTVDHRSPTGYVASITLYAARQESLRRQSELCASEFNETMRN
ncbi:MAG: hypothetical protein RL173_367 [Fibrobacterota bacterium]|jgi:hypothetical protein